MAFGKHESYSDDIIEYKESVDMLLIDLKMMGYKELTKEKLNIILQGSFSIGSAVRRELCGTLDNNEKYFEFLDDLRDSGTVNMFSASVDHLREEFGLRETEAMKILSQWIDTYDERHPE